MSTISDAQGQMPLVCEDHFGIGKETMQKLAEIAFAESKKNGIPMRDYNSVFAIIHPDVRDRNGKLEREGGFFAVRFSPNGCGGTVLDGGGFDVDIDPVTFAVTGSRLTGL